MSYDCTFIRGYSDDTLSTVCVENPTLSDATQFKGILSHIIIGTDTPDTLVMASYNLPDAGVNVFVGPIKYSDIKTRHPVSVYSVDQICYLSVINKKEIYLLVNTVGDKGAFP